MREGWTIMTIGEVALHLCDGSHNPPVGIDFSEYPMLSSKNIFFDSYDYSEPRYLTKEQFDIENKRTNVSDGDILLTIVGTIGRVCCIKEPFQPFTLQRSVAVIKPNKNIIISRYLMYCLCGLNAYFNKEAKGVAQKGIYLKQLSKISIPVPPLQEQERIVAELDLLTGVIDKQKQQLKELDTLAQSIFYDMFGNPVENEKGWIVRKLGDVCGFVNGFAFKSEKFKKEGLPVLRISNIQNDIVKEDDMVYFSPSDYKEDFSKYQVIKGDIVIAMSGATTGKLGVHIGSSTYYLNQRVGKFLPSKTTLNKSYLLYYLKSMSAQILNDAMGVAQPNISSGQIKGYDILVPPMDAQISFATIINTIASQKESINRSLAESQKLFDYTMDKYFG